MPTSTQINIARFSSKRRWLIQTITLFVSLLFVYTAVDKLLDYGKYVAQMQMIPFPLLKAAAPALGLAVPLAELAVVGLLFADRMRKTGLIAALAVMVSFEIYIGAMLLSGVYLPCSCGGIISTMGWPQHLVFNAVVITLLALAIYWYRSSKTEIDNAGIGDHV